MASPPPYGTIPVVDGAEATFTFDAATGLGIRVYLNSDGEAAIAGATQKSIGVCYRNEVTAALARGNVRFNHNVGTQLMIASEAIADGEPVYAAADGKVAASGTILEGIAKTTVTADGDQVEVMPVAVIEYATSVTVSAGQAAANSGNGQVDIALPFAYADSVCIVQVLTVTTGRDKSAFDVTGTSSTLSVKGVAAATQLDEGDIVKVIVKRIS